MARLELAGSSAGYPARRRHHDIESGQTGCHMASCTACTRSSGFLVATPSSAAARATATGVVAEEARRFSTAGSKEAPVALTSAWPATASAAASSMPLVTLPVVFSLISMNLQRCFEEFGRLPLGLLGITPAQRGQRPGVTGIPLRYPDPARRGR